MNNFKCGLGKLLYISNKSTIIANFKDDNLEGLTLINSNTQEMQHFFSNGKLVQKPSINAHEDLIKLTKFRDSDLPIINQEIKEISESLEQLKDKVKPLWLGES